MAKLSFLEILKNTKDYWMSPIGSQKSFIPTTQTTLRNEPWKGATDKFIEFMCNNPIASSKRGKWINLFSNFQLMQCYQSNPVGNAVINIKADAWANMRYKILDLKNGEEIAINEYTADGGILKKLLFKPNPRESGIEWRKAYKVNYEVFGNSYVYASVPVGAEKTFDYKQISVMNNLPPANLETIITGKWLESTELSEIIEKYVLTNIDASTRDIDVNQVWQNNTPNIQLDENFVTGTSKLVALRDPLSNILGAFETRNVMIYNRGALGFLSSEKVAEGLGSIALDPDEIDKVQTAMDKYGTTWGQYQHIVSPLPMKYVRMAMSVKDLMVFEEVEADAIAVSNAFGVPEILVKYYITGATFENQAIAQRKLYDSTIIPESEDFMIGMNDFFRTEDNNIQILASFDHVAALQANKKDEAETNSKNGKTMNEAFFSGAVVYNDYLTALNLPNDKKFGDKRIWDLNPEQQAAIKAGAIATTNIQTNGNE